MAKRISKNALFIALMCITGLISISIQVNVKLTLQLIILLFAFAFTDKLIDKIIIPLSYLIIGLFIPVFGGFQSGITPTFGFVIGFVLSAVPYHFINKTKLNFNIRYFASSVISVLTIYIVGTIFLMFYLKTELMNALLIGVLPYIIFDIAKIILVFIVIKHMPKSIIEK